MDPYSGSVFQSAKYL